MQTTGSNPALVGMWNFNYLDIDFSSAFIFVMIGVLVIFCALYNSQRHEVTLLRFSIHTNLSTFAGDLLGGLPEQEVEGSDALPLHHLPHLLLPRCRRCPWCGIVLLQAGHNIKVPWIHITLAFCQINYRISLTAAVWYWQVSASLSSKSTWLKQVWKCQRAQTKLGYIPERWYVMRRGRGGHDDDTL